MKRCHYGKAVFILFAFFNFPHCIYSQKINDKKEQTFILLRDNKQPITDLSDEIKTKCSELIKKTVGDNSIEVRFQPEFGQEAENLAAKLEKVMKDVQVILSPLKLNDLKFYILWRNEIPVNYKMTEKWRGNRYYVHLAIIRNKKELNTDNCLDNFLCGNIFEVMPHELAHTVTEDLIKNKNTRWFDDGLAEYVGNKVLETFSPDRYQKKIKNYVPTISLFRDDIRENIFFWREPEVGFLLKANHQELSNEIFKYSASYQIIKQMAAEAENKGISNPINVLLTKLKERKEKLGKPAGSEDIISLIQQYLSVNPKTLAVLDEQEQKKFVVEALNLLSQNEISFEKKNYALNILAGIDNIQLTDKWINYLLDEIYQTENKDEVLQELAATALARRFMQENFNKTLENYLTQNKQIIKKSSKQVREELQKLSLRPKIE